MRYEMLQMIYCILGFRRCRDFHQIKMIVVDLRFGRVG